MNNINPTLLIQHYQNTLDFNRQANVTYFAYLRNLLNHLNARGYLVSPITKTNRNFCIYLNGIFIAKVQVVERGSDVDLTGGAKIILGTSFSGTYMVSTKLDDFINNFRVTARLNNTHIAGKKDFFFNFNLQRAVGIMTSFL